jgi:hypothetical protein
VRVQLEPVTVPGEPSNGLTAALVALVKPDGSFEFPAVIPGAYRLTAAGPRGWWARAAAFGSRDLLDDLVVVRTESMNGVMLAMIDRPASIGGALSTPAGDPAPGYFVVAFPADRKLWIWPSRRIVSARPATNGSFEFQQLPPGDYRLAVVTDLDDADLGDSSFLEMLAAAAVTVSLGENERKIQDLRIGG